jgi:hypothetical protein
MFPLHFFRSSSAKKILQRYLFWQDMIRIRNFQTMDDIKETLQSYGNEIVYLGREEKIYLVAEEASAYGDDATPVSVDAILQAYDMLLLLLQALSYITQYEQEDISRVPAGSRILWFDNAGVPMHYIEHQGYFVYPKSFDSRNSWRYGYLVVMDKNARKGIFSIEQERIVQEPHYDEITIFANLAQLKRHEEESYEIYDLDNSESVGQYKEPMLPSIHEKLAERLNLEIIDLEDYLSLFPTPKHREDLDTMGLWGAKVGVIKAPEGYGEILKDPHYGKIGWETSVTADIFDMSVELPVVFEKKDGGKISLGIDPEVLLLEDRSILKDISLKERIEKVKSNQYDGIAEERALTLLNARGVDSEDERDFPVWLQIHLEHPRTVPSPHEIIENIIALETGEKVALFNEIADDTVLFRALAMAKSDEIEKLGRSLAEISTQAAERVMEMIEKSQIQQESDTKEDLIVLLKASLYPVEAKSYYLQKIQLELDTLASNFESEDKKLTEIEMQINEAFLYKVDTTALFALVSHIETLHQQGHIPDAFCRHIAKKFRYLRYITFVVEGEEETQSSTDWLFEHFWVAENRVEEVPPAFIEILVGMTEKLLQAKVNQDKQVYFETLLALTRFTLLGFYPVLRDQALENLYGLMSFMAEFDAASQEEADAFLELFEEIPKLYETLSFESLIKIKYIIIDRLKNTTLKEHLAFSLGGKKSKMILLNYLVDMEDLWRA